MGMYKVDPNNSKKQVPVVQNRQMITVATTPAEMVIQERPQQIVINNSGSYGFIYNQTSQSVGHSATTSTLYTSGSFFGGINGGNPFTLPIQPVAWKKLYGTAKTGDVTFIYERHIKGEL